MKQYFLSPLLVFLFSLASCDSGDILDANYRVEDTGKTVKVTGRVSGLADWEQQDCHLALAGFSASSRYAVMQRALSSSLPDGSQLDMVLSNLTAEVNSLELALTNRLRERIISLQVLNLDDYSDNGPYDTIYLDLGNLDLSLFGTLQQGIFDKACVQCHGANGRAAGNLDLTQGKAKANLVDIPSTQKSGYVRVTSGDPSRSLLHLILNEGGENMLRYNHTEVLSSQFKDNLSEVKALLTNWITSLQPQ